MHCRSTQTAEHLACIFGIGTLFILCNPDKVRSVKDTNKIGHQCQRWPMTVACGYGRSLPTNRLISAAQRHHHDFGGTEFLPLLLMNMCSGAEGGGGGCDGGGDGAGGSACGTILINKRLNPGKTQLACRLLVIASRS
ncbi:unnamed protein product [Meloidogyne enterolobii]|uniref:Uncharacterized protein n=1 Tax=Meloidogyne enterolobii TaxID=390850 RepID=A0ACB0XQ04_MELEN